jgi:type VI secretion system protein ImpL
LFSKDHVVVSPLPKNDGLVADVRAKLSTLSTSQRIYSRLRGRLERVDLPEFNLIDAAGPQAANVFTRRSNQPLNRGVPGLFTYQGYWDLFDKEIVKVASEMGDDEGWVLGLPAKTLKTQLDDVTQGKLVREVRMAYLRDYADIWDQYLNDVQLIQSDSLQTSIQRLRVLSAPDSPLPLFLRGVVKETTLLRENRSANEQTVIERARQTLKNTKDDIERVVGPVTTRALPPDRQLERIVDDRFEPLRRLTGLPGAQGSMPIDATLKMLDEYYGSLVATDAAIRSGGTPPPPDAAVRMRAEAARMPQPVRGMLDRMAATGAAQTSGLVRSSIGANLSATVGDFCRRAIAGRYPLSKTAANDVVPEDFARLFAPGGLMEEFFEKNLASIVDTSNWTFKKNIDGSWSGGGGSLASFQKASLIRDVFFRAGGKTPTLRLEIKTLEMDPSISNLSLDVDGTIVRYSHGPQMAQTVTWPGPRGRNQVLLQVSAADVREAGIKTEGAWALHRFFDKLSISAGSSPEKFLATANVSGKKVVFEISANSVQNPFRLRQLEEFSCPSQF